MKKFIPIAFLSVLGTGVYQSAHAQGAVHHFYVCSETEFVLVDAKNDFTVYEWLDPSNPTTPISTTASTPPLTAPATSTPTTMVFELRVEQGGCWSDPDSFIVHVLPPLQVEISGLDSEYCDNSNPGTVTATATITNIPTGLPTGVTADQLEWFEDNVSVASGPISTNNTHSVSIPALNVDKEVKVIASYTLPSGAQSKFDCDDASSDLVKVTLVPAPTTPAVIIQ